MADRDVLPLQRKSRRNPPLTKTPRRHPVGAAFFVVGMLVASPPHAADAARTDPVCGPRQTSLDLAPPMQLPNDIPLFGDNVTQEATSTIHDVPGAACGRVDLYIREVAFEQDFRDLRAEYVQWLEDHLTGRLPLTGEYVRNHGVKVVDQPGVFRFLDSVKAEPDYQGRLQIHLTEERGANGRSCRQVILRYSYLGGSC